jgi:hypothetical protein
MRKLLCLLGLHSMDLVKFEEKDGRTFAIHYCQCEKKRAEMIVE